MPHRRMAGEPWIVGEDEAGERLDRYLARPGRAGSRSKAADALERGKIFVNDDEMSLREASRPVAAGDRVRLWTDRPGTAKGRPRIGSSPALDVLFEDDHLVVINKPAGLLSVPLERKTGQDSVYDLLVDRLRSHGKRRPFVVHRIDQDTSGLVLFAKHAEAHTRLKAQFARHEPERVYLAVVYGHPEPAEGEWRDRLVWDEKAMIQKATHPRDPRGVDAVARYRLIERFAGASLIQVRLLTGRRNQIRLQARLRGHTLIGEERYVFGSDERRTIDFGRQALHAWRLGILHPADLEPIQFEAPLAADMQDLLTGLGRRANSKGVRSV